MYQGLRRKVLIHINAIQTKRDYNAMLIPAITNSYQSIKYNIYV